MGDSTPYYTPWEADYWPLTADSYFKLEPIFYSLVQRLNFPYKQR